MDEKQILKEIAFYSRYINEHEKLNKLYDQNKIIKAKRPTHVNKYKYVKKPEQTVIKSVQNPKVHINPNFKLKVHINPHFQKSNFNIHINPKILTKTGQIDDININLKNIPSVSTQITKKSNPSNVKNHKIEPNSESKREISKNMVSHNVEELKKTFKTVPKIQQQTKIRRKSICSKYKIVKSNIPKPQTPIKNMYKIDRRNTSSNKSIKKRKIYQGISDLTRNNFFGNKIWRNTNTNSFKLNNKNGNYKVFNKLTNINGVLYKNSKNKLQKLNLNESKNTLKRKRCISVKGQKYILSVDRKYLKLLGNKSKNLNKSVVRKLSIRGVTYVQKTNNLYVRCSNTSSPNLRKTKGKLLKSQVQNLRKNNLPCPVYRRFGFCRRKDLGRCQFVHNPDQIYLCKKFLQGACLDDKCLLSHKVSVEKMPTCKYFLEGYCTKAGCPFLHVKISPKAEICKNFLQGFCSEGTKCNKRHQFLCPEFEKSGKCPKRRCQYPHKTKTEKERTSEKTMPPKIDKPDGEREEEEEENHVENIRYYIDTTGNTDLHKVETLNQVSDEELCNENNSGFAARPKLGILPSFIPFM